MKKIIGLLGGLLFTLQILQASTTCTASTGTWTNNSNHSFDCADISNVDVLIIPSGVTVTISSTVQNNNPDLIIRVFGTISFEGNSSTLELDRDAGLRVETGGWLTTNQNNNSQKLKFGNSALWTSGDGNIPGFAWYSNNPLAVEMSGLEVWKDGDHIVIDWTTISEHKSDYFVIERSKDGRQFQAIGQMEAKGNSEVVQIYRFRDEHPLPGTNYYRIKEVDWDGSNSYSAIKSVWLQGEGQSQIWQNPSGTRIFLKKEKSSTESRLEIYDLQGHLLHRLFLDNRAGDQFLDLPELETGQYALLLFNGYQLPHSERLVRLNMK